MAERNDVKTLEVGKGRGMVDNNGSLYLTLSEEMLAYVGTTTERILNGQDKLVLKFDFAEKRKIAFLGLGKKVKA